MSQFPGSTEPLEGTATAPYVTNRDGASARVLFDARWIVTAAEGRLLEDLGWTERAVVGQRVARLLSRSLLQAARPVLRVLRSGASVRADVMHQNRLLHIDAHRVTPTDDGAVARLDITDLTWDAASEHERAHIERLEAIGYVATGISHEINTPVQFVSDNLRFLQGSLQELLGLSVEMQQSLDESLSEQAMRARLKSALSRVDAAFIAEELSPAIDAIHTGLSRITRVAGDLRSFAKPPRGKSDISVSDEIALAVGLVQRELRKLSNVDIKVAEGLPLLTGHAGDLAQVLVSVLREVATQVRVDLAQPIATDSHAPEVSIQAFSRRDWQFINVHLKSSGRAALSFAGGHTRAADAPVRPMLADGFNVARALLREHYGGHLVIISEPDGELLLTIGLPLQRVSAPDRRS